MRGPAQEPPLPSLGHQDGTRVRPDQDLRPPPIFRETGLHDSERARARRRRRTLLRPAASLRTRSRGIAPPTTLGARPRNPNIDYSYFPLERP